MSESVVPTAPPLPDITRDRLLVVGGGATYLLTDVLSLPPDHTPVWVTRVPLEPTEFEKDNPGKAYPREGCFRILHEVIVGTVDELVDIYRQDLIACWRRITNQQEDDSYGVNPMLGEAGLRKHVEVLRRNDLDRPGKVPLPDVHKALRDREQRRNRLDGLEPRQDGVERDLLKTLVGDYRCRTRARLKGGGYGGQDAPTDDPRAVQALIDALTTLKEDSEARRQKAAAANATV